jgi:hypothetical protein
MLPGAAAQQELLYRTMRIIVTSLPTRRPADDLELVIVAVSDHIATGIRQPTHDVRVTGRGGPMHCRCVVTLFEGVGVEPALEQQIDDCELTMPGRMMQQSPGVGLVANVELLGIRGQGGGQCVNVPRASRVE